MLNHILNFPSSENLNCRMVHIKERTSKWVIFTNCFKMSCFTGPTCFEIKFYSIELILLCYNTYLCKFCSLYLFEYLFNAPRLAENTGMVPNSSLFTQSHQPICLFKMSFFCIHGNRLLVYYFLFIRQRRQVIAVKTLSLSLSGKKW